MSRSEETIVVTMNDPAANKARGYPSNFIKTAKYTAITFVPLNLVHQFRKVSNFYFLINMIVALIPGVSPISPFTAVLPLAFVIGVALIKDGYEDYLRHQADSRANSIHAHVVRKVDGRDALVDVESADVHVGDIIYIKNGEELRADVVLLSSSGVESAAFIETCNLDGETNLKNRKGVEATWGINNVEAAAATKLEVVTGGPDPGLLHWAGVLKIDGKETAIGLDQFLYRSSVLKNTEWAWGVVVYAGVDTKMFRNLQEKPPKMSGLDYKLNWLIFAVLVLQQIFLILIASLAVGFNGGHRSHWYAVHYIDKRSGGNLWGFRYLAYFILLSYMIPISLFVTIELCKVAQAKLMAWDHEMFEWMHDKWQRCTPNTSNLNEQLSQVRFIFSDKTGTLTENVMKFKRGDVLGVPIDADDVAASRAYMQDPVRGPYVQRYMRALALCHTIQPFADEREESGIKYDGASPDEAALVDLAVQNGIVLKERFTRSMTVYNELTGANEKYEILATLEFTPDRKMMSIVLREPDGRIVLYTKGADSFVMPRMNKAANAQVLPPTLETLGEMAALGLRTLLVCTRTVSPEEFSAWHARFVEAGKALTDRSKAVDAVCLELETELELVGATAIEDKLQDQVPETLQFFLRAGVVVWMLTGDKRETAVTIAATSTLANPLEDFIDHIDIGTLAPTDPRAAQLVGEQLQVVKQHVEAGTKRVSFVIDGPALMLAMEHHKPLFIDISQRVSSAVCCRLTPLQKANVVNMFQTTTGLTALAIGDGANDVSMIQEGRVGVGIVGLEGAQAALAADYAIPRFKHLRRLCAVHGRYALVRNALCILFSFYKNLFLSLTQVYYSFWCGFSGQSLYDGWLLSFFNFAFTSAPPLAIGIVEKDLPERELMRNPKLFADLRTGLYFNMKTIALWFAEGAFHSLVVYFVMYWSLLMTDVQSYRIMSNWTVSTIMMTTLVFLSLVKLSLHVRYWQVVTIASIAFSVLFYLLFVLVYSAISLLFGYSVFYAVFFILLGEPKFWLYSILFLGGLVFPIDMAVIYAQKQMCPDSVDEVEAAAVRREAEAGTAPV